MSQKKTFEIEIKTPKGKTAYLTVDGIYNRAISGDRENLTPPEPSSFEIKTVYFGTQDVTAQLDFLDTELNGSIWNYLETEFFKTIY